MTTGSHARPAGEDATERHAPTHTRRPHSRWRWATPVLGIGCGALFAVSAVQAQGDDLRPDRAVDLAGLVDNENETVVGLQQQVVDLKAEVDSLAVGVATDEIRRNRHRADEARPSAGLTAVAGPGVTVTLSDAPAAAIGGSDLNPNLFLVHQQNIQAVVNAMWRGGAEGITIQGQRVVSTTGIKCAGSNVQLQGAAYPQPYVISAVGDQEDLIAAITADPGVIAFRELAADPRVGVGFDLHAEPSMALPAYDGPVGTTYASVIRSDDD